MALFSKTNVMFNFFHNLALFWVKTANFFANFFYLNVCKIITSVPGRPVRKRAIAQRRRRRDGRAVVAFSRYPDFQTFFNPAKTSRLVGQAIFLIPFHPPIKKASNKSRQRDLLFLRRSLSLSCDRPAVGAASKSSEAAEVQKSGKLFLGFVPTQVRTHRWQSFSSILLRSGFQCVQVGLFMWTHGETSVSKLVCSCGLTGKPVCSKWTIKFVFNCIYLH
jgi:hypothetical protein